MQLFRFIPCLVIPLVCVWIVPVGSAIGYGQEVREQFNQSVEALKELVKKTELAGFRYHNDRAAASKSNREEFEKNLKACDEQYQVVKQHAMTLLDEVSSLTPEEVAFFEVLQKFLFERKKMFATYEIGKRLLEVKPDDVELNFRTGTAALYANQLEDAKTMLKISGTMLSQLSDEQKGVFSQLPPLELRYARELELREAEKDLRLPQVEMETTQGTIVIELFEEQAPNTVANFIDLVESGFYDNKLFHRVITGFVVQGGGHNEQGVDETPPFTIDDETDHPDARSHLVGTISMAKATVPNSGSSQFFFSLAPNLSLDGVHTVFGRVISGVEHLEDMIQTHTSGDATGEVIPGITPDKIIKARVLTKRDHPYVPKRNEKQ